MTDIKLPQEVRTANRGRRVAIGVAVVVVLIGLATAVVLSRHTKATKRTVAVPSSTTAKPRKKKARRVPHRVVVLAPLTGLPAASAAAAKRCAVTAKIGNTQEAHPLSGLDEADVVYEEVVDGGITRLAAVFQSHAPDKVGPLRSVRPSDQYIVWPIRGVFAFSGGNDIETGSIQAAPVTQQDETRAGPMMYRDPSRVAPYNLYAHVDQLYTRCADPAPSPVFVYRKTGSKPVGIPVSSATVGYEPPYAVTWKWDAKSHTWKRWLFGAPDSVLGGGQISTSNVVVMSVPYPGGATLPDNAAKLVGSGQVTVFTAGRMIRGTWTRPAVTHAAALLDSAGHAIRLTPGQTWVELPDPSYPVTSTP